MRTVVALLIAAWAVMWVNRGQRKKIPGSVGKCGVCNGTNTITETVPKPNIGECKRCLECGCAWGYTYYKDC